MRIAVETNHLETSGVLKTRRSTIQTSRKTFRMVIDGIYSDKVGSIVRELAANAWDSHKRAGNDKPFYIHCPTPLKPEFFIRDYGVGMSDQMMEETYIVVGKSDKDMTDDEVGKWGLGSKSPFSVTDQYYISCYDGETVRQYGYGIGEDGVPTLYLMAIDESDEPKGVRVGFAVESKDFEAFRAAIEYNSIGHNGAFESNIPLKNIGEIAYEGEGWAGYTGSALVGSGLSGWYARQGCVLYPISGQQVELPYANSYQRTHAFVIDCPIGTVQVTTSREAISYEPEVITYLNERVGGVKRAIEDAIRERIKDIESVVEFFETLEKIKPAFVQAEFTHPATGLKSTKIDAQWPTVFFEAVFSDQGRWDFKTPASLNLKDKKLQPELVTVIDDISALMDPSREDVTSQTHLSHSEQRRISRFVRAYLESQKKRQGVFFMGVDWSDEFWKACFPNVAFQRITFDDLRNAVPRRVAPPKEVAKPPIKGLALAKGAGEQKPVFEVGPCDDSIAWVSSEQYRRQASALFKLAKRFQVSALYISAPGSRPHMTDNQIPHLKERINAHMADSKLSFGEWIYYRERIKHNYNLSQYLEFLQKLLTGAPKTYTALAAAKGSHSEIAKALRPYFKAKMPKLTDEEFKGLDALLVDDEGRAEVVSTPAGMQHFEAALKQVANGYSCPTCKFAGSLGGAKSTENLVAGATALIAVQSLLPASY